MLVTYLLTLLLTLQVIVTHDVNHDGKSEGVGAGRLVALYRQEDVLQVGHTDPNSSAFFFVDSGVYTVEAYIPPTRPFYEWVCRMDYFVAADRIVELHCKERFVLRFPFALR